MKTNREWLSELPDGYRERALGQCKELDGVSGCMDDAIMCIPGVDKNWSETSEGEFFWFYVHNHYQIGTPLPPLPQGEVKEVETKPTQLDGDVFVLELTSAGELSLFKRTANQFNYEGLLISQSKDEIIALRDLLNNAID